MSALEQNIIKFISDNKLIESNDKLLLALSGGADSVFALTFLTNFKNKYSIRICALHINHSLRGDESDGDEKFCMKFCSDLNIEFYSEKIDIKSIAENKKLSIEEAARNIRYEKLEEYLKISNSDKIVTAHNLDDNTETVLLNLFRGTGLKGLSGIPVKRDNIIRPFLSAGKSEIIEYLNGNNIEFRIDSTNKQSEFKRNYLRNEIIPKIRENINPKADRNILRLSQIIKNAELVLKDLVTENASKFISYINSELIISKEIKRIPSHLIGEVIRRSIEEKLSVIIDYEDFLNIQNLIDLQVGSKVDLSQNLEAVSEREYLLIRKKMNTENSATDIELYFNSEIKFGERIIGCMEVNINEVRYTNSKNVEFINADGLVEPLVIRRWEHGDKFNPLGLKGTKNVSDFLTENKVPASSKNEQLVLLNKSMIIWVVGYRIDESVKISNKIKKAMKLWIK
ncbi:tRNA(Ile)-lysidine synthetase [hydrothermal vent metagenome]|uniref:tRNA(Ile)-lysidine synthetase n=1 Tax=hydrothermal vent metagenome TaxID=652676 RepID=A0A3B1CPK6_9ZZZZ